MTELYDDVIAAPADDRELSWWDQALCAQTDPELFFPDRGQPSRAAKRVCQGCPVRGACLDYALLHDERFGVWGGLSERERRPLRRPITGKDTTTDADADA